MEFALASHLDIRGKVKSYFSERRKGENLLKWSNVIYEWPLMGDQYK
jgi:hypothetical protein